MNLFRSLATAALLAVAACSGDTAGPVPVASVTISPDTATFGPGETRAFTAVVKDASGNVLSGRAVQWFTNLPAVATVDADGRVTGKVEGLVDLYAESEGVRSSPSYIVVEIPIATLTIEFANARMAQGSSQVFNLVARDAGGRVLEDRYPYSVTSSAPGVVELRANYMFALAPGTATLTGKMGGRTTTAEVTVVPRIATVAVSPAGSLTPGATRQLTAQVKDAGGAVLAGRAVTWSSSAPAVASVDSLGLLTAHALGTTHVTATSEGVLSAPLAVTVRAPAASVSIQPAGARLVQGEKRAYTVTARDAAGQLIPRLTATVSSSAPGVVSVRGDTLHAVAPGAATVTATVDGRTAAAEFTVLPTPTPVGGILAGNVTWTRAGSPYALTNTVQVVHGSTLTIEPGVLVLGEGKALEVWGTLHAVGTAAQPIHFENTQLRGHGEEGFPFALRLERAVLDGGTLYDPTGNAVYGSLVLRHSTLRNLQSYLYVWYPTSDVFIEGNRFVRSGGISAGGRASRARIHVRNNVFVDWTGGYAVENWVSYDGDVMVVERNSFLGAGRTAVRLPRNYTAARMSAAGNYWGTTDETVIRSMIFDRNDDLASAGTIAYTPFLTAPDPATPAP